MSTPDAEFEEHLDRLTREDPSAFGPAWQAAGRYFAAFARSGGDITRAVQPLVDAFLESHQVPVLEATASALVQHCANINDPAVLETLLAESDYPTYVIGPLREAIQDGCSAEPFLPLLCAYEADERYLVHGALAAYLTRSPDGFEKRWRALTGVVRALPPKQQFLPALVTHLASESVDVSLCVPDLLEPLQTIATDRDVAESAADALPALLRLGVILESHRVSLEAAFAVALRRGPEGSPEIRENVARCLAVLHARAFRYTELDALLESDNEQVREGARIGLDQALREAPTPELLERSDAPTVESAASPASVGPGVCRICSALPRVGSWTYAGDVPGEAQELTAIEGALYRCPECGVFYNYSYEAEYEDMSLSENWSLSRLGPARLRKELTGQLLAEHVRDYPELLSQNEAHLRHAVPDIRADAAWFLAEDALFVHASAGVNPKGGGAAASAEADDGESVPDNRIVALLRNEDALLRVEAARVCAAFAETGGNLQAYVTALRAVLADADRSVQSHAATALARHFMSRGLAQDLRELLCSKESAVALAACRELRLRGAEAVSPSTFATELTGMVGHPDRPVRREVHYALREAAQEAEPARSIVAALVSQLNAADAELRSDCIDTLRAIKRPEVASAVAPVAELLMDGENNWHAAQALKQWAQSGISITAAFPRLAEALERGPQGTHDDLAWALQHAMSNSADISAMLPALLSAAESGRVRPTALTILDSYQESGGDLTDAEACLIRWMDRRAADSYQEHATYLLVTFYLRGGRFADLEGMLGHKNKNVRGPAAARLTEEAKRSVDFSPLFGALSAGTCDAKASYVRSCSARALAVSARISEAAAGQVRRALENTIDDGTKLSKEFRELYASLGGQLGERGQRAAQPPISPQDINRAFVEAAARGDLETVRAKLEEGLPVDVPSDDGTSALGAAAGNGQLAMVEFLISSGADLNHVGGAELTPLMQAVLNGHGEVGNALLTAGALVTHDLLASVSLKIRILRENTISGMVLPGAAESWQAVLAVLERRMFEQDEKR